MVHLKPLMSNKTGLFIGHVFYAVFFLFSGFWRMYCNLKRYNSARKRGKAFRSRYINPLPFWRRIPLESGVKAFLIAVDIIMSIYKYVLRDEKRQIHHFTLFSFNFVQFCVEMAVYLGVPLPPDSEYTSSAFMFTMNALTLAMHLPGPVLIERTHHAFILGLDVIMIMAIMWSYGRRHSIMASLAMDYCMLLMSSWLFQTSFLAFPPRNDVWDSDDADERQEMVKMITMSFLWHCEFVILFVLLFYFVMDRWCYRRRHTAPEDKILLNGNGELFRVDDSSS